MRQIISINLDKPVNSLGVRTLNRNGLYTRGRSRICGLPEDIEKFANLRIPSDSKCFGLVIEVFTKLNNGDYSIN